MPRIVGFWCLLLICSLEETTVADKEVLENSRVKYESLHDVFQSYPVDRDNTDQEWKFFSSCNELSGRRETTHADSTGRPRHTKSCQSVLQNCRYDESMKEIVHFCASEKLHRRYGYMIINGNWSHIYGRKLDGTCSLSTIELFYKHGTYYPCLCDCENVEREMDRYFSLLDVVSDDDKVVTGVQLRKIGYVFYIQIQQGRLGASRAIDGDVEWKDVKSVAKSDLLSINVSEYYTQGYNDEKMLRFNTNNLVYAVTSEQNTVLVDDLIVAGPDKVLTGLRFRQVDQDLGLEIQVTPFHNKTGKLERSASRWMKNKVDKSERQKVILPSLNVPGQNETFNFPTSGYRFIKFQVSDFKNDLGQTTVPFIDMTEVVSENPRPLFGAGIFHKGNPNSAGIIALNIVPMESPNFE